MNQYAGPAPEARLHAFRDDALGDHDATALADLLRRCLANLARLLLVERRCHFLNPSRLSFLLLSSRCLRTLLRGWK